MSLVITIRTANRAPQKNYLRATARALSLGTAPPSLIHIFPTDPAVAWLESELGDLPVCIHAPDRACGPNENGVRQVEALNCSDAEWLVMLEDDLEFAADIIGSMTRWLADHARPDMHVYRMFALPGTPLKRIGPAVALAPLREMKGSQAVAMRAADARLFAAWATAHPKDWRPKGAPFEDRPTKGFDKLVGYWALQQWPQQRNGLVALPMLANHIGRHSTLHSHGVRNDAQFLGQRAYSSGTA